MRVFGKHPTWLICIPAKAIMTTMEILGLLALENAYARPSLTGPEWHEIMLGDDRVVPLPAADFDMLRDNDLIAARDEGGFFITKEGRRRIEG